MGKKTYETGHNNVVYGYASRSCIWCVSCRKYRGRGFERKI